MDVLNTWGPTNDLTVIGLGNSELDDYATAAAAEQKRTLRRMPSRKRDSTIAPITSTSRSRACPRSIRSRVSTSWQACWLRQAEARRVHGEGLSPAAG
jgi:hypothetical protein